MSTKKCHFPVEIQKKARMSIKKMTLFSNPMTVAYRDKTYAAYSVETLLGVKVTEKMKEEMIVHTENILTRLDKKDARLDALIEFPSKKIHIEIQYARRKDEIERAAFYIGSILFDIGKGKDKIEPYNLTSIWICNFNPLKGKAPELPYYTFKFKYDKKEDVISYDESFELDVGITLIFINARYKWQQLSEKRALTKTEQAIKEYVEDMQKANVQNIVHKEASDVLSLYKEGGSMYNKLHEEYMRLHGKELRQERKKYELIGEQKGEIKGKISTAKRMLQDNLDIAFIAKYTNLDIKKIESLR